MWRLAIELNLPFDLNSGSMTIRRRREIDREGSEITPRFHRKTGGEYNVRSYWRDIYRAAGKEQE